MTGSSALVPASPPCLTCGAPVPRPFTICFGCGGSPFYADVRSADFSVVVEPVPAMKQRAEIARVVAELSPGLDRSSIEVQLAEGQPPLWVARGLSEAAATALVARFRKMHAPARMVSGEPAQPGALAAWMHPLPAVVVVASILVGFFWQWAAAAAGLVVALLLGFVRLRGLRRPSPLAVPPLAPDAPEELEGDVRRLVAARTGASGAVATNIGHTLDRAREVFHRLGDEQDPVGFIAGGIGGAVGQGACALLAAAAQMVQTNAASTGAFANDQDRARALQAIADTFAEVSADLAALAANPNAEADLGARLHRNAARLQSGATLSLPQGSKTQSTGVR